MLIQIIVAFVALALPALMGIVAVSMPKSTRDRRRNFNLALREAKRRTRALKGEYPGGRDCQAHIFPLRSDYKQSVNELSGISLGDVIKTKIDRSFPIEAIFIRLSFTPTAAMATANADGLLAILRRINLTLYGPGGPRSRVELSGPDLIEYMAMNLVNIDRQTQLAVGANGTTAYVITFPIWCAHPELDDRFSSPFDLPVHLHSADPELTLEFSTQAQMDTNGTATFAIAAKIAAEIIIHRRDGILPPDQYIEWDLVSIESQFSASGTAEQRIQVSPPGLHTGHLLRMYTSATARGDIIDSSNPTMRLEYLGTMFRRFKSLHLQCVNDYGRAIGSAGLFTGAYFNDFLTDRVGADAVDFGSVLDMNIPQSSGAKMEYVANITGGTGVKLRLVQHRVFRDIASLTQVKKAA